MILSAGLTPAWQHILVFDGFRPGEVNRAAEVKWCASGKVFNAGIAAHLLGGPSLTLAPVGGPNVESIEQELDELGVPCRLMRTVAATRVCTTILDRADHSMTELVENGTPLDEQERDAFRAAFAEEAEEAKVVVLIGSLPEGTPDSFYRELLEHATCPAVLDFRGDGLLGVLDLKPLVVKPNREELGRTLGRTLDTDEQLLGAMRELCGKGAHWVVITQGSEPVWATSRDETYRYEPPRDVEVVNPIGCGDAMAAGIAWAVRDGRPVPEAVRLGIGAALDNLQQLLPSRISRRRVEKLAERVQGGKV